MALACSKSWKKRRPLHLGDVEIHSGNLSNPTAHVSASTNVFSAPISYLLCTHHVLTPCWVGRVEGGKAVAVLGLGGPMKKEMGKKSQLCKIITEQF